MADKNKKPEIRFKGFSDEWEEREFTSVITRVSSISGKVGLPRVEYEDIISGRGELNKNIYKKESSKIGIEFDNGDVLFGKLRPYLKNWLLSSFKGIAVGDFWVLRANEIDSKFIYYLIQTFAYETAANQSSGTKMPRSDWNLVSKTEFNIPTIRKEQSQLGNFFNYLDYLITLHHQKYNKLVTIKKAMLEKMFPKNGADVPEIRFKGYTEGWKERKVGELFLERNTQAPKSEEYPLMAFVANVGVVPKGDRYNREFLVNDQANKKYKQTEQGDFIYSSNNLESGSIGLNNYGKASISPVYSIFQPTELAVSDFIGRLLVRKSFINQMVRWRQGVIYGQWRIHESDFIKIEVDVPSLDEQKQIGAFFKHLDTLITLQKRELEKLNNIKKACLEKMFV